MIPAVPPSSLANTLETLAENQDEDEDMGEEWSFWNFPFFISQTYVIATTIY